MPRKTFKFDPQTYAVVPNMHMVHMMKGAPLSVYIIICKMMNEDYESWPSVKTLAAITGYSESQVITGTSKLVKLGVLKTKAQFREDGSQTSNRYEVRVVIDEGGVASTTGGGSVDATPLNKTKEQKSSGGAKPPAHDDEYSLIVGGPSSEGQRPEGQTKVAPLTNEGKDVVTVRALYYRVMKMYGLPVYNHPVLEGKITSLETEVGTEMATAYLQALLTYDLRQVQGEYKPVMANALDIYGKRVKILNFLQQNVTTAQTAALPTEEEYAAQEAERQAEAAKWTEAEGENGTD